MLGYEKVKSIAIFSVGSVFLLLSCGPKNSMNGAGPSVANTLDEVSFSAEEENDIVEHEEGIYVDQGIVIKRKKFWAGYKDFVKTLKVEPVSVENPEEENRVSSVLGDKKLVMITPAIWEDTSHFLVQDGDKKNTREYKIFDTLGDFFIHPSSPQDDSSNGSAAFAKWVWGFGNPQGVFMDILVTPKLGHNDEKNTVTSLSDAPEKLSTWSDDVKKEENSLYLVVAFPIHAKKPRQALSVDESFRIKEFQQGLWNHVLKGRNLVWPFGTSLDFFFSKAVSEISSELSGASYEQVVAYSAGVQSIITKYKAISEDVFGQMSGKISDGFGHSNSNGSFYYSPGLVTQSIAYSSGGKHDLFVEDGDGDTLFATKNSVLMVPFLIQKVLTSTKDSSKKGFLLRGNPLAMRVLSLPDSDSVNYPSGLVPISPKAVDKLDLEKDDLVLMDSFAEEGPGYGNTVLDGAVSAVKEKVSYLWTSFTSYFRSNSVEDERKKEEAKLAAAEKKLAEEREARGIFDFPNGAIVKNGENEWTKESLSKHLQAKLLENSQEFSWSNVKKVFEEDNSRKDLLQAKKKLPPTFSVQEFATLFEWRQGVSAEMQYNVGAILDYAGYDLIFWPEEDLDHVKSFITP